MALDESLSVDELFTPGFFAWTRPKALASFVIPNMCEHSRWARTTLRKDFRSGATVTVPDGAVTGDGRVWGTYLHGVFENDDFRHRWLRELGWQGEVVSTTALRQTEYDWLADVVKTAVDWAAIDSLLSQGAQLPVARRR
jgi:hypothetical protein